MVCEFSKTKLDTYLDGELEPAELKHLAPGNLPKSPKIDELVERYFKDVSELQGKTVTYG